MKVTQLSAHLGFNPGPSHFKIFLGGGEGGDSLLGRVPLPRHLAYCLRQVNSFYDLEVLHVLYLI